MKKLNRRDVLKSLAALSAASTLGPLAAQAASSCAGVFPHVNIVLHGMQALVFDQTNKKLNILVPNVPGHSFAAGNFGHEQPLEPNTLANPYLLNNVTAGSFGGPAPNSSDHVVISWSKSISGYGDAPYCVFQLPWPDCFIKLREYQPGVPFFLPGSTVTDHSLDKVTSVPMIYVLTYTHVSNNNVALAGVKIDFDTTGVAHAHIVSEPAFENDVTTSMHPNKAFSMLNTLFDPPLDLRINSKISKPLPPPQSSEPVVANLELYSTSELRLKAAGLIQGGHPRNCMAVNVIKP